jgi:hypothetical protein
MSVIHLAPRYFLLQQSKEGKLIKHYLQLIIVNESKDFIDLIRHLHLCSSKKKNNSES